jgi:uncharacterized membrane protein YbhN (UPF0104 family)
VADTAGAPSKKRWFQIARIAVSVVLVVAMFWFVLPQVADVSKIWAAIRDMTWLEITTLVLAATWNLVTYWLVNMATLPGLTFGQSVTVTESATAVANTLPGGSAVAIGLTYTMFGSWGISKSRSTVSVLVSGIWNNFAKLAMPVFALALLALQGNTTPARILAGGVGMASLAGAVVVFAAVLRKESTARAVGNWAGRRANVVRTLLRKPPATGWDDAVAKTRGRIIGLLGDRWIRITVITIVGHFSLFLVLVLALRHVGVSQQEVSWIEALAVFAFVRLATAIPLSPGGLGIVELGLIAGLSAAGGVRAEVAAAVLVFRALTYLVPIPFGLVTYLLWRRSSWKHPLVVAADAAVPPPLPVG